MLELAGSGAVYLRRFPLLLWVLPGPRVVVLALGVVGLEFVDLEFVVPHLVVLHPPPRVLLEFQFPLWLIVVKITL